MWVRWLAAVVTIAAVGCDREPVEPFADLDRDGDSRISRDEASADPRLDGRFTEVDADADGELSAREYLHAASAKY